MNHFRTGARFAIGLSLLLLAEPAFVAGPFAGQDASSDVQIVRRSDVTRSSGGMVVAGHPLASEVGRDVLAAAGNAVDAAIATGFALAVTHPSAGNIGGGGFMVIRFPNGTATALDFREKAPLAAHPDMFVGADGEYSATIHHRSHVAVGVPGTVAGFVKAHQLYGTGDWGRLVAPAARLAEDGFTLTERQARSIEGFVGRTSHGASVAAYSRNGEPYATGDTLRLPDLGATLRRIEREGRNGFYAGETARLLVAEMERGGGLITLDDLDRYQARERTPVTGTYRGYEIVAMPPPSSGGVALVEMLEILEDYDLAAMGHNTAPYLHRLAEAMRIAFRDRARYLADQDFYDVPVHRLTSQAYADQARAAIQPDRAGVSDPGDVAAATATAYESPETTHYSVVDANGMAVAVTYTLEAGFGSGITVPGAGFLLNNEMGDFNGRPGLTNESGLIGTEPNLARPEQRMLSSMSPTIIARDGALVAVIGSPGGRTIINTVLNLVLNLVDHGMSLPEAVEAPRSHHQWLPDTLRLEAGAATDEVVDELRRMGHTVQIGGSQGLAHSIWIDALTGERVGVPDPRNPDATASGD